jgi:SAM-dependent methyltransferase
MEIIACPACGSGNLEWRARSVECQSCKSRFEVSGGIPIMLVGKAPERQSGTEDLGVLRYVPAGLRGLAERSRRFVRPSLVHRSRNRRSLTEKYVDSFTPDTCVLNIGAGSSDYGGHVLNLDVSAAQGIHVVGMAEHLPFHDAVFDGIVFQAVLEHVTDSHQALSEIRRVLRPGGSVFIEVPFIQGYHAAPRDHRRYTEQGLRAELEQHGLAVEETGVAVGPASGMAWVTAEFIALLLSGRSGRVYRFARLASAWLAWPIKWADAWLDGHEMAHVIASGVWAQARKPRDR